MFSGLGNDDIVDGLRELIARTNEAGLHGVSVQIIGGAALKLAYFDRAITVDIDARLHPGTEVLVIAEQIAAERGWPNDWLNDSADKAGLLPAWGRGIDWRPLYSDEAISIEVAPVEALLAMKLRAFERRGRRDLGDVLGLLAIVRPASVEEIEGLFEEFFPGDVLQQRTVDFLEQTLRAGLPAAGPTPICRSRLAQPQHPRLSVLLDLDELRARLDEVHEGAEVEGLLVELRIHALHLLLDGGTVLPVVVVFFA